jgi:hypothetical protein
MQASQQASCLRGGPVERPPLTRGCAGLILAAPAVRSPTNRSLPRGPGQPLLQARIGIIGVGLSARVPALRDTRRERAPAAVSF